MVLLEGLVMIDSYYAFVVVSGGQFRSAVDFEQVGSTRMADVMAQRRDDRREPNDLVHVLLGLRAEAQEVSALHHSYAVVVIVEGIIAFVVLALKFLEELSQYSLLDLVTL
jgi:hypothetical protein